MSSSSSEEKEKTPARTSSAREQARKLQAKQESSDKRKSLILRLGVVGLVLAMVAALAVIMLNRDDTAGSYAAGAASSMVNEAGGIVLTSNTDVMEHDDLGEEVDATDLPNHFSPYGVDERIDDDKPHVVIYTDAACPHCASFESENHQFINDMLEQELITVEYRSLAYMDQSSQGYSSRAGNAFTCMAEESPENYFEFFGSVTAQGEPASAEQLVSYASEEYGADIADCVDNSTYRALTSYTSSLAEQSGVTGTPMVFVDGENWQDHGGTFPEMVSSAVDAEAGETEEE